MIIDIHGHYTTAPKALEAWRNQQIAGIKDEEGDVSPGVLVALLMMGGAVLWFVLGLAAGRIFFYPPILFVLGIINFFRCLTGHED